MIFQCYQVTQLHLGSKEQIQEFLKSVMSRLIKTVISPPKESSGARDSRFPVSCGEVVCGHKSIQKLY